MRERIFRYSLIGLCAVIGILTACHQIKKGKDEPVPDVSSLQTIAMTNQGVTSQETQGMTQIPEYQGEMTVTINGGEPFFTDTEKSLTTPCEKYAPLDALDRCGSAFACVCAGTMPIQERGDISSVHPSGWHQARYEDLWAYERCHLIAYCLTGEDANTMNLITGTHSFNQAMIPYEIEIAQWVEKWNGHCIVRVTPCFKDQELVARGVLYEAYSVETDEIRTCVFIHNIDQTNAFTIDYQTGQTERSNKEWEANY